jgi:hypothetical protein
MRPGSGGAAMAGSLPDPPEPQHLAWLSVAFWRRRMDTVILAAVILTAAVLNTFWFAQSHAQVAENTRVRMETERRMDREQALEEEDRRERKREHMQIVALLQKMVDGRRH